MRKLFSKLVILLSFLLLLVGCNGYEPGYQQESNTQKGDDEMSNQLNDEQAYTKESEGEHENPIPWAIYWSQHIGRYNLDHMLVTDIPRATHDIDFQTIERFLFSFGNMYLGHGLVIDRMHGMVHFNNRSPNADRLPLRYRSGFRQDDLDRLAQALEEARVRNWREVYQGADDPDVLGARGGWNMAMLFSDGTIMRRRGGGLGMGVIDFLPPQHEWDILANFIYSMGADIIERHHAENAQDE